MTQASREAMADAETLKNYGYSDPRVAPALRGILQRDYKVQHMIYAYEHCHDSTSLEEIAAQTKLLARSAFRACPGLR